ncbi:hypothetical protein V3C99_002884, partial [Haemonchus contortus]
KFIFFSTISTLTPYLSGPGASENLASGVNSPLSSSYQLQKPVVHFV